MSFLRAFVLIAIASQILSIALFAAPAEVPSLSLQWKAPGALPLARQELSGAVGALPGNIEGFDTEFQNHSLKVITDQASLDRNALHVRQFEARFFSQKVILRKRIVVGEVFGRKIEETITSEITDFSVVARLKDGSDGLTLSLPPRLQMELRQNEAGAVEAHIRNEAEIRTALAASLEKLLSDEFLSNNIEIEFDKANAPLQVIANGIVAAFRGTLQASLRAKIKEEMGRPEFVASLVSPLNGNISKLAIGKQPLKIDLQLPDQAGEALQLKIGNPAEGQSLASNDPSNLRVSTNTAFLQLALREYVRTVVDSKTNVIFSEQAQFDGEKEQITLRPKSTAEAGAWLLALNGLLGSSIAANELDSLSLALSGDKFPRIEMEKKGNKDRLSLYCILQAKSKREGDAPFEGMVRITLGSDASGNWYVQSIDSQKKSGVLFAESDFQSTLTSLLLKSIINKNLSQLQAQGHAQLGIRLRAESQPKLPSFVVEELGS